MLVLSRKIGEQIVVPHCQLTLTVLAVDGHTVRVGSRRRPMWTCTGKKSGTESASQPGAPYREWPT
jgi:hypothetical protein